MPSCLHNRPLTGADCPELRESNPATLRRQALASTTPVAAQQSPEPRELPARVIRMTAPGIRAQFVDPQWNVNFSPRGHAPDSPRSIPPAAEEPARSILAMHRLAQGFSKRRAATPHGESRRPPVNPGPTRPQRATAHASALHLTSAFTGRGGFFAPRRISRSRHAPALRVRGPSPARLGSRIARIDICAQPHDRMPACIVWLQQQRPPRHSRIPSAIPFSEANGPGGSSRPAAHPGRRLIPAGSAPQECGGNA